MRGGGRGVVNWEVEKFYERGGIGNRGVMVVTFDVEESRFLHVCVCECVCMCVFGRKDFCICILGGRIRGVWEKGKKGGRGEGKEWPINRFICIVFFFSFPLL